jgi:predicted Fe-Mo cluster-binding NifX family protein
MRLCIPVRVPNGLESCVEPYLPVAEHLLLFDTGTREFLHVALREWKHTNDAPEAPSFDVVLCESFDEATRRALTEKGIRTFGTDARTAAQAIAEFEALNPGKELIGGCGQGRSIGAIFRKSQADALRIAVSSQNGRTITGHVLRCHRFWVYEIRQNRIDGKTLREIAPEQTLRVAELGEDHPLDDVHVMITITAAMTPFLYQRLRRGGIKPYVTEESDPDKAVRMLLEKVAGFDQ